MDIERKVIRAYLPCKLSESERIDLGVAVGELYKEINEETELYKKMHKENQEALKDKTQKFRTLLYGLKSGILEKEIDATQVKDYVNKIIYIEHNGERHQLRELKENELQMELFEELTEWKQ